MDAVTHLVELIIFDKDLTMIVVNDYPAILRLATTSDCCGLLFCFFPDLLLIVLVLSDPMATWWACRRLCTTGSR